MSEDPKTNFIRHIGEKVILERIGELSALPPEERGYFVAGMEVAAQHLVGGNPLEQELSNIKDEVLAAHGDRIKAGVGALLAEYERAKSVDVQVPGTTTVYTIVACKKPPVDGKVQGETVTVGSLGSLEAVESFVAAGGLPAEYPFYAVYVVHANFYVLVSGESSPEELSGMRQGQHQSDARWRSLKVWSGPHRTVSDAKQSLSRVPKSLGSATVATMCDPDAEKLERVGGAQ